MQKYPYIAFANLAFFCLAGGIWYFDGQPPTSQKLYLATFCCIFILVSSLHLRQKFFFALAIFACCTTLGAWRSSPLPPLTTPNLANSCSIRGRILEPPRIKQLATGYQLTYLLTDLQVNGQKNASNCYLTTQQPTSTAYRTGSILQGQGRLLPLTSFANPRAPTPIWLRKNNLRYRIFSKKIRYLLQKPSCKERLQDILANFRHRLASFLAQQYGLPTAAVLFALLFGGYENIDPTVIDAFAQTGLIHILSVSGSHITLLAAAITWCCTKLFLPRLLSFLVLVVFVLLYSALADFSPPVLRAALLGLLLYAALLCHRQASARYLLALVGISLLLYEPLLLFDLGFQLSFAATAGLLYLGEPCYHWLSPKLPFLVRLSLAATFGAQLACLPFLAWYFGTFSLAAFLSNIFIAPLLEAVIIIALLGAACFCCWQALSQLFFQVAAFILQKTLPEIMAFAALPYATIALPPLSPLGISCYGLLLCLIISPKLRQYCRQKVRKPSGLCAFAACWLCCLLLFWHAPAKAVVHFLDVGQGDAALLIAPQQEAALIDTGGLRRNEQLIAQRVILPQLQRFGINKLNYIFLSHPHADHASAIPNIIAAIPTEKIIIGGRPEDYAKLWKKKPTAAIIKKLYQPHKNERFQLGALCVTVLETGEQGLVDDLNEASQLLLVQYGNCRLLFTGDLTPQGEQRALRNRSTLSCTVLKVPHHGSGLSSTVPFIAACRPSAAIISVGANNDYGHPAPRVLSLLKKNCPVFRTDLDGSISLLTDGRTCSFQTVRSQRTLKIDCPTSTSLRPKNQEKSNCLAI